MTPRRTNLSPVCMILLLGACGSASPPQSPRARQLAELQRIADACDLPVSAFGQSGSDHVRFQPPPDAEYESVECALAKLKNSDLRFKMGFVGNGAFEPGNSR